MKNFQIFIAFKHPITLIPEWDCEIVMGIKMLTISWLFLTISFQW